MSNFVPQNFSLSLAGELLESSEQFPVDFNLAWQWLGYSAKDKGKRALISGDFIEGIDFTIDGELPTASVPRPEQKIFLTVDCLKSWGMMSGTEQGKKVRKYFLDCERVANSKVVQKFDIPETLEDALILAANQIKARKLAEAKNKELEAAIEASAPATALGEAIIDSKSQGIRIGDFAKVLGDVGQNQYFDELRNDGIIQQFPSRLPYQRFLSAGYFRVTKVQGKGGASNKWFEVSLITPKGQAYLAKRHKQYLAKRSTIRTIEAEVSAIV